MSLIEADTTFEKVLFTRPNIVCDSEVHCYGSKTEADEPVATGPDAR